MKANEKELLTTISQGRNYSFHREQNNNYKPQASGHGGQHLGDDKMQLRLEFEQ